MILNVAAGETLVFDVGPIKRENDLGVMVPVDLTLGGTKAWMTAKRKLTDLDTAAEFQAKVGDGLVLDMPNTTDNNMLRVTITGDKTADIVTALALHYDVWVEEPSARRTRVDSGFVNVMPAVTLSFPA
jgi:hypothetical protein